MDEVTVVGGDIAQHVFQIHGMRHDVSIACPKRLPRSQFIAFLAKLWPCVIVTESCAAAHFRARETGTLGHGNRA